MERKGMRCTHIHAFIRGPSGRYLDQLLFSCIQSGQNVFRVFSNFKLDTSTRFDSLRLKSSVR